MRYPYAPICLRLLGAHGIIKGRKRARTYWYRLMIQHLCVIEGIMEKNMQTTIVYWGDTVQPEDGQTTYKHHVEGQGGLSKSTYHP